MLSSARPDANDLLMGGSTSGDPGRTVSGNSDLELRKIMWERLGWDPPIPEITDIERNPGGKTETQKRRPRVVPPGRDTALLYWSPTNTAKMPSDQYLLNQWKLRQVLIGTALDQGIQDLAVSHQDDKNYLNDLVYKAMSRAGSDKGASQGTARHKLAEKIDFGIDPGPLSDRMRADLDAYREATRGLEMVLGEVFVVHDDHKMAGTFDRICYYQGRYYIADLKPPGSGFGQGEHAIQFAIYSRAQAYNWNLAQHLLTTNAKALKTTNLRADLPAPLDQERAIVIHVPRDGIGRASTAWVDISAGWEGFEHAQWMRKWQNRDFQEGLVTPFEPKRPAQVIDLGSVRAHGAPPKRLTSVALPDTPAAPTRPGRGADVADRPGPDVGDVLDPDGQVLREILQCTSETALKAVWRRYKATWTQQFTTAYTTRRAEITGKDHG